MFYNHKRKKPRCVSTIITHPKLFGCMYFEHNINTNCNMNNNLINKDAYTLKSQKWSKQLKYSGTDLIQTA